MKVISIVDHGIPFNVVIGADIENKKINLNPKVISFFDARYNHYEYGQYISSYLIETLIDSKTLERGIDLDGGIPDWYISGENITKFITDYLTGESNLFSGYDGFTNYET